MTVDTSKLPQAFGNYDVIHKIAEGGMGAVFKCRNRSTGDIVAVKVLPPTMAKNPVLLERFKQEFRAASSLDHVNVVRAIEYSPGPPSPFLVMEFVDGVSLGQRISEKGPFEEDEAIRILAQVCQGLHRAHKQGMIHRDVKPDNVMLNHDRVAKLTDLGLVKQADEELNLTRTGRGLGTPHFMAPEQFRNAKNADVRCDIYSLGATLYMMVTGEVPFGQKIGPLDCWMKKIRNEFVPPREIRPDLSERIDWAIRRAMSGDASQRPNTCKEFIEDLTGVSIKPPPPAPAPGAAPSAQTAEVWYLVYRDEEGDTHTVKGTLDGVRKALKDGLLGDATNVRGSKSKQGEFRALRELPEFRDMVISPGAAMPASASGVKPNAKGEVTGTYRSSANPAKTRDETVSTRPAPTVSKPLVVNNRLPSVIGTKEMLPNDKKPKPTRKPAARANAFDWRLALVFVGVAAATALMAILVVSRFG